MRRSVLFLFSLSLSLGAAAQPNCGSASLPQGEGTPQVVAAARALAATNPCKLVPGFTAKSLGSVWASLLSSTRTGGRRLESPVPVGAPQGLTLPEKQMVHFDFSELAGEQLRQLRVEVDQKPILNMTNPPAQIDLPTKGLGSDQTFLWSLTTARSSYRAEFRLLPEAERQEVETRLARLGTEPIDAVSRLIYQAAIYDDADLFAQRDRAFQAVRKAANF